MYKERDRSRKRERYGEEKAGNLLWSYGDSRRSPLVFEENYVRRKKRPLPSFTLLPYR